MRFGRAATRAKDEVDDPRRVVPVRPSAQVAARIGLWALVGIGACSGMAGVVLPAAEPATRSADASDASVVPPQTAGFAELAVRSWLEATDEDEAAVDALYAVDPSTSPNDGGRRRVDATATVAARRVADDYWAVTVAATVRELVNGRTWRPAGTWYLEVGVRADADGALTALSEPALVPAPAEPDHLPRPAGPGLGVPSGDDEAMADTVQGFLTALVAGDGDVSRYLAPDVTMAAVTPAPFAEIQLQRWSKTELSDGTVRVRVSARAVSAAGVPRTLSYELGLAEREGRWEVTSLSGAPTLDDGTTRNRSAAATTTAPADATTTSVSIASSPGA